MESLIGKDIDGYHILEVIGRGGMGVVYKALDTSLDKVMALKMIDPVLAQDENFLRRFKTEARALAKLENPNIVTVHALRETQFGVFMVMEYVAAKTLLDWIRDRGAFSWEDTVHITKQLLNAVGHAHRVGVIHRDIKPGNILLTNDMNVKVTDFGLAKLIRQHGATSTVTQMRAGTLYYMSPEQVKGLKNVDFRSDIYSLGMTIYEMLVGRTPFEKTESDFTIQKIIVEGQIPSMLKFKATIPKPLVKIISKSIEKEPEKRYQNAEEMQEQIEQFESSFSKEEVPAYQPAKTINSKFIFLILSILVVLFLGYVLVSDPFEFFSDKKQETPAKMLAELNISTTPLGASVWLDGNVSGTTPLTGMKVEQGRKALKIEKSGFLTIDTIVFVHPNKSNDFQFGLQSETVQPEQTRLPVIPPAAKNFGLAVIISEPSEASVWIDDRFIGTTPREGEELKPGRYTLLLRKSGYAKYTQTFNVRQGETIQLRPVLEKVGGLAITSDPAGAEVFLSGISLGTTPLENKEVKIGNYQLVLRKSGYEDFATEVNIAANQISKFSKVLVAMKGDLKILIRPWGSIYIDGELQKKDTNIQYQTSLPAGLHQVKAVHPNLGEWEQQVKIESNRPQEFVIDFNREVNLTITSEPNGAEILVDGKATGKYTPKQLKMRTGKHRISVQKEGYSMEGGALNVNVNEDVSEPFHFKLRKSQ